MTQLVQIAELKSSLRIEHNERDADLQQKLDTATELLMDYMTDPDDTWTPDTAPQPVRAAVIIAASNLFRDPSADPINEAVKTCLYGRRDPPIA